MESDADLMMENGLSWDELGMTILGWAYLYSTAHHKLDQLDGSWNERGPFHII